MLIGHFSRNLAKYRGTREYTITKQFSMHHMKEQNRWQHEIFKWGETETHKEWGGRNVSRVMENITKWNSFKVYIGIWALNEFSAWKTHAIIHRQMRTVTNEQKQMDAKCMVSCTCTILTHLYSKRFVRWWTKYVRMTERTNEWTNGTIQISLVEKRVYERGGKGEKSKWKSRPYSILYSVDPFFQYCCCLFFLFLLLLFDGHTCEK